MKAHVSPTEVFGFNFPDLRTLWQLINKTDEIDGEEKQETH